MDEKKEKKLLFIELILLTLQLVLSIAGDFIHQRFMSDGASITIKEFNFISPMTWGYGNIFPVLFIIATIITGILLINAHIKNNYHEDRLSSNILVFAALLFLMVPLLLSVQQINLGLVAMVTVQFIIFVLNVIRTRS